MAVGPAEVQVPGRAQEHGEVFTRRWVVDLILEPVGAIRRTAIWSG